MPILPLRPESDPRWFRWAVLLVPLFVAAIGARPYAGSWNDGSRLATVESLVDRGTLAIDESVFVRVPVQMLREGKYPYAPDNLLLLKYGTADKLLIDGHYYSDKPAVISYLLAVPYQTWRWLGLPSFRERPDLVCYFLTLFSSGLVYVFSVCGIYALSFKLGLRSSIRIALVSSFAFSTVTLPYLRHVNNHLMLLGVMVGLVHLILPDGRSLRPGDLTPGRILKLGTLLGIGYNLDLGLGPVLMASFVGLLLFRSRDFYRVMMVCLVAFPWVAAQLGINYALGGVLKPVNTVPEYLAWPGSPFTANNLTGFLRHDPLKLVEYSLELMFGKQGFIGHNLPLFLLLPCFCFLVRPSHPRFPEMLCVLTFCFGGWGMYSLFSNNYGGACCSVRWFVPFLIPGFYLIAELLRKHPQCRWDLYALGTSGAVLGVMMWSVGPWTLKMVPLYWPIQILGLAAWVGVYYWRVGRRRAELAILTHTSPTTHFARAA